jgi:hypothetical protein
MWMVLLNGAWQPAANDAMVIQWIQQGYVGPHTQIRHVSAPQPVPAAMIPNFAGFFPPMPPQQQWAGPPSGPMPMQMRPVQQMPPSQAPKFIGAGIAGLVVLGFSSGITIGFPAFGVLIFVLAAAAVAAFVSYKLIDAAPAPLRKGGEFLSKSPLVALVLFVASPVGAMAGFGQRTTAINECNNAVKTADAAAKDNTTFTGADPMKQLEMLDADVKRGRASCEKVSLSSQTSALDSTSATLQKQANEAVCVATSKDVLNDIPKINGQHDADESLRLLTAMREKLTKGIAACDKSKNTGMSGALNEMIAKQVDPQIEKIKPIAALSATKKAEIAKAATEAKVKADASARAAAIEASIFKVPVATMLSEYKNNEIRGDTLYKGKTVQITGRVGDTKRDIMNDIYVTVGTGEMFEIPVVQCFFDDKWANAAAQLSKGQSITIRGRVEGLMMNVLVKDCEIVAQ